MDPKDIISHLVNNAALHNALIYVLCMSTETKPMVPAVWERTLDAVLIVCMIVVKVDPTVVFILTNRARQTRQAMSFFLRARYDGICSANVGPISSGVTSVVVLFYRVSLSTTGTESHFVLYYSDTAFIFKRIGFKFTVFFSINAPLLVCLTVKC